jgi:hypothetical protein
MLRRGRPSLFVNTYPDRLVARSFRRAPTSESRLQRHFGGRCTPDQDERPQWLAGRRKQSGRLVTVEQPDTAFGLFYLFDPPNGILSFVFLPGYVLIVEARR